MKKDKLATRTLIIVVSLFFMITTGLKAQVTIGLNETPATGALLQLKDRPGISDGSPNATKGLGLPRVKLTDPANLFPMFLKEDGINPTDEYVANKSSIDLAHIGLMVYHIDNCTMYGKGVYIWEDNAWTKIGNKELPGIRINPNVPIIYLPSGRDLRSFVATPLEITVGPDNNSATLTPSSASSLDMIGFMDSPLPTSLPPLTTILQLMPDKMNATNEVTAEKPWFSKETKLTFVNSCGTKDIILNQTNFAMKVGTIANSTSKDTLITFHGINQGHGLVAQTNAQWKLEVNDDDQILQTYAPANGTITGSDKYDGTINSGVSFNLIAKPGGKGLRFIKSYATFSDTNTPKRFNDIVVELRQCQGTEDLSAIETLLYETEYGLNKVKRHKDSRGPNGDYDFYSADFGTAGRWMITNLSAVSYDPTRTDNEGIPSINITNDYNPTLDIDKASWGYPTKSGSTNAGDNSLYSYNPHYGLLYTWTAATGGRISSANEAGQKYTTDGGTQVKIQGICPNGWHLPSDLEWTMLEKEIITNTTKYSAYDQSIKDLPGGNVFNENLTHGPRNNFHGKAMKDGCEPIAAGDDLSNYGSSNRVIDGGFSVLLAGYASPSGSYAHQIGAAINLGHIGSFISASSKSANTDIRRSFNTGKDVSIAGNSNKYQLSSVRCVKD